MKKTLTLLALASTLAIAGAANAQPRDRQEGPVTREEALSLAAERFAKVDANSDGFISADEVEAAADSRRRARRHGGERMFASQDTNDDGFISLEEATSHAAERFDRVDTDNDGILTEAEREAARETMRERLRERRGN